MERTERILQIDVRFEAEDELYIAEIAEMPGLWASGPSVEAAAELVAEMIPDYMAAFEGIDDVTVGPVLPDDNEHEHAAVKVLAGC